MRFYYFLIALLFLSIPVFADDPNLPNVTITLQTYLGNQCTGIAGNTCGIRLCQGGTAKYIWAFNSGNPPATHTFVDVIAGTYDVLGFQYLNDGSGNKYWKKVLNQSFSGGNVYTYTVKADIPGQYTGCTQIH